MWSGPYCHLGWTVTGLKPFPNSDFKVDCHQDFDKVPEQERETSSKTFFPSTTQLILSQGKASIGIILREPNAMGQQLNHPAPIILEPTQGYPVTVYPYDNTLHRNVYEQHAHKHVFQISLQKDIYRYEGQIPITSVKAKRKRLLELLHDYTLILIEIIKIRTTQSQRRGTIGFIANETRASRQPRLPALGGERAVYFRAIVDLLG